MQRSFVSLDVKTQIHHQLNEKGRHIRRPF